MKSGKLLTDSILMLPSTGKDWRAVRQQYLNRSYASQEEAYKAILGNARAVGRPLYSLHEPSGLQENADADNWRFNWGGGGTYSG
jgi:hypothetical protein